MVRCALRLVQRPSEAPFWGPFANLNVVCERAVPILSGFALTSGASLVLERVWRVVPRLSTVDLEAAAHLRIAVDADDLVALRAFPALEPVGRALERHARAALAAHLALQGGGTGTTCVAREVSAHVVVSLLLPVSAGPHHQHGPTLAILHPPIGKFRMRISYPLVLRSALSRPLRSSPCIYPRWTSCEQVRQAPDAASSRAWCGSVPVVRMLPWVACARVPVELGDEGRKRMARAREVVERAVTEGRRVYGVSTGFGLLANTPVAPSDLRELQRRIVLSHATGSGDPLDAELVRAMLLLRARTLTQGSSGVRPVV